MRLGRTTVVCGIKAEIATSNPLRGDEGYFGMRFADTGVTCTNLEISEAVNVNVPSACSGSAETKSPSDISVFATQYITDLIERLAAYPAGSRLKSLAPKS